jgi:hypothetical protein
LNLITHIFDQDALKINQAITIIMQFRHPFIIFHCLIYESGARSLSLTTHIFDQNPIKINQADYLLLDVVELC